MTEANRIEPTAGQQDEATSPTVIYVLIDGSRRSVRAKAGVSIMQTALDGLAPGIEGECGGFLNCATCHVYVDDAWLDRLPPISQHEDEMLNETAVARRPNSRLSCRIRMTAALDGVVVTMPARQI
jgi:2Fe-2S ferredoxin